MLSDSTRVHAVDADDDDFLAGGCAATRLAAQPVAAAGRGRSRGGGSRLRKTAAVRLIRNVRRSACRHRRRSRAPE